MAKIAFFGVGLMGEPMVNHLLGAGHQVVVVPHRSRASIERVIARGATEAKSAAEAIRGAQITITVLPTADDVEATVFAGPGTSLIGAGQTLIDMGTSFPPQTRRLAARVTAAGGRFLDAPVTGGPKGAQDGTLTIMVGGEASTLADVRPVLEAMSAHIYHFGPVGAGHTAKLIQNMIGIITSAGIAEGFAFASAAGLDVEQFFQMLASSTSNSPALQGMVPKVFAGEFERVNFRLDLAYKDIRQATALAREMTVPLPVANGAVELMQLARAFGYGSQDSTAMIRGLESILRVEVRPRKKS
ncbi:MAG TPA: NAD(P)-dependent oxidoreductase [bacterium]|nr:NAD(P)-dependent oxidoreductase [bacterium]